MAIWVLLFLYIAKVAYDYMVWFLIRSLFIMVWPFVLQFSSFPFLMGALINEVDFGDLEAYLFLQCSSFGEVDFLDLETRF